MIAHRASRDIARCRRKYGDAWLEYERRVPYLFIPVSISDISQSLRQANGANICFSTSSKEVDDMTAGFIPYSEPGLIKACIHFVHNCLLGSRQGDLADAVMKARDGEFDKKTNVPRFAVLSLEMR